MMNIKRLVVLLGVVAMALNSYAQKSNATWRVYHKTLGSSWYNFEVDCLDSIVYTDKNYDVDVYSTKGIADDGAWLMKVRGYGEISIASIWLAVVPADMDYTEVHHQFSEGRLANALEAQSGITYDFPVDDGSWRPVIFGYDEEGRVHTIQYGEAQTFISDFTEDIQTALAKPYEPSQVCDWGYGSLMHVRDVMGEDMVVPETGYDWYSGWANNANLGIGYRYSEMVWRTLFYGIDKLNTLIPTIEKRNYKVDVANYLGAALAQRAMLYLDAARMYEFLENDKVDAVNEAGNNVSGLTFPILNEPWLYPYPTGVVRATRSEMADFLRQQLDEAEQLLEDASSSDKLLANLNVVYGLKARLNMWLGDYEQAQMYAERVIGQGGYTPLTRDEWLSTTRGFNDRTVSSWMWALRNDYKILNYQWVSFCCNETSGDAYYTGAGAYTLMGRSIYDRMSDTDFRKLSFKAPSGSSLAGQEPHLDDGIFEKLPNYASLKFRPGQGSITDVWDAAEVDIPLMRVEEMQFIVMEALAQRGEIEAARGRLTDFMKQYRDASYTCELTDKDELIDEIFLQKRIELWGEGQNFFDYKRLNKPVTRGYEGTNFPAVRQFNTTSRPAWMNFVFNKYAYGSTIGDWNNPDPSGCYTAESY